MCRRDPDLEDARRPRFEIIFGMPDTGASAHHLYIARLGPALVAETVFVRDGALAHICNNFHIGVGMGGKARIGGDLVVVPNAQRAPAHSGRVRKVAEREVVPGLEPAMIRGGKLIEWSAFEHRVSPGNALFDHRGMDRTLELKIEIIEINRF